MSQVFAFKDDLRTMAPQKFTFRSVPEEQLMIVTQDFSATPDELYEAFTSVESFTSWFAPAGWHIDPASVDIQVKIGGQQKFTLVSDENPEMQSPVSSKYTVLRRGKTVEWREEVPEQEILEGVFMGTRFSFEPVSETVTRVELRQGPLPEAIQEMAAVGWGQTLQRLQGFLDSQKA